jgi:uncharacterized RDD family membrane protein YckC
MDWYYVDSGQRVGPVNETEVDRLVREGKITAGTLVWHAGMAEWQRYESVKAQETEPSPTAMATGTAPCSECGRSFSQNDMIRYENSWICAECKPIFFQRVKEGAILPGVMVYGGFWIRFAAKFVDGIVLGVANQLLALVLAPVLGESYYYGLGTLISVALGAAYTTFLLGKYGATLGKMAFGLKVVTADGGKVSYGRACGRHFAEIISSLILCIGYIMAAFDEQKRTLHDRICNTRVIKK